MAPDSQRAPALRAPPHSIEAEQSVLGSILLEHAAWNLVGAKLQPEDFYRPGHQLIFEAIAELAAISQATDVVTVGDVLKRRGRLANVGGLAYLATLARDTPTAANIASYAAIVREHSTQRKLLAFARRLEVEVADGAASAKDVTTTALEWLIGLQASVRQGRGLVAAGTLVGELIDDLDRRSEGHRGLPIGLPGFDAMTGGLDPGDLVVIAGRPAMGKTALLVTIAANVSVKHRAAVFSAEMPALQLMRRSMAMASGISQGQLRRPERLDEAHWKKITDAAPDITARHLFVDETAAPSLAHVRAECTALKARGGLELVLVDYLQLLRGAGRSRYEELRDVAYGLKALAKDLGVPVIALAQLNRDVEKRGDDKRPTIADLRDSGAIEEAADIIGMLYREGYYSPSFGMPYVLECNVVKHRNGELGQCLWNFAGERSLVTHLDEVATMQYRRVLADQRRSRRGVSDDL